MATSPSQGVAGVKLREKQDERRAVGSGKGVGVSEEEARCSCCPFGYHIDLGFVNFCDSLTNGSALAKLKRIQRTKRKLRKSMELMLRSKQGEEDEVEDGRDGGGGGGASSSTASSPCSSLPPHQALPPDVVHSTESSRLLHLVNYEESATSMVLKDIDSAVNATLASIEGMQRSNSARAPSSSSTSGTSSWHQRFRSTDSDDSFIYSPITPLTASHSPTSTHTFPFDPHSPHHQPAPLPPPRQSSLRYAHHHPHHSSLPDDEVDAGKHKDSKPSVSSVSCVEQVSRSHFSNTVEASAQSMQMSSGGDGGKMSASANGDSQIGVGLVTPQTSASVVRSDANAATGSNCSTTGMTSESLAALMTCHLPQCESESEAEGSPMSPITTISKASLAAIREAITTSLHKLRDMEDQVRTIPILQVRISVLKEEKRLLDLQMKASTKSGGSTPSTHSVGVGTDHTLSWQSHGWSSQASPASSPANTFSFSSARSPLLPAKTPPPTMPKPSCPRLDKGVGEHSVLEPYLLQPALPTGYTTADHQVQAEIVNKESSHLDVTVESDHSMCAHSVRAVEQTTPLPARPETRSVGVGDSDVTQPLQTHSTEIRTVILGGATTTTAVSKHNVGVEVKVPSRSGVMCSPPPEDSASSSTRTVGVNVRPMKSKAQMDLDLDLGPVKSVAQMDLRQSMVHSAPLQPRAPEVRTVGTFCSLQPAVSEVGVQHQGAPVVSVACGGDEEGLELESPQRHGTAVLSKPDLVDACVSPQRDWMKDAQTNALTVETSDKHVNTNTVATDTAATSTDPVSSEDAASQTRVGVFEETVAVISTGSNTTSPATPTPTTTTTTASNTRTIDTADTATNTRTKEKKEKACSVKPELCDASVNTTCSEPELSMARIQCVDIAGSEATPPPSPAKRPLTMQEQILQRGADQALAFLGSTSSSTGSLSPTSPTTKALAGADAQEDPGTSAVLEVFSVTKQDKGQEEEPCSVKEGVSLQASSAPRGLEEGRGQREEKEQDESVATTPQGQGQPQGEAATSEHAPVRRLKASASATNYMEKLTSRAKHRLSDGAMNASSSSSSSSSLMLVETNGAAPGMYSGRRVGSVEDFMPDEMRRLMNLEAAGPDSSSKAQTTSFSSRTVKTVTKTTKAAVTTSHDSSTTSNFTDPTPTAADSTAMTTTREEEEEEVEEDSHDQLGPHSKPSLSAGHLDLSQIVAHADSSDSVGGQDNEGGDEDEDGSRSPSECFEDTGGIKDSGYYDSSTIAQGGGGSDASSLQGLSPMGSLERRQLKSIMKAPTSDAFRPKRGISFADSVVGGTGSSSEEEATESDEESTTSYEEGSYDGREGDITYECQDDQAIAQGLPGAKMYDQNIRETYELSEDMSRACQVLANFLVDSTTIQTKELNANLTVVQDEWFRVSSHKLSSAHQVEDYLSSINEISHRLLEYIVNLIDANGNAAIHYCVSHCNFEIVGLLLDTEVCDMLKPNKAGYTPTMLASLAFIQNDEHRDIISRLFTAGDVNAHAEKNGQTALMLATSQGRGDMVELLIQAGANVNQQDFEGSTALMVACEHGHTPIVTMLLAQPACDPTLTDNENSTALSIAMEAGHKDIGVILYKRLNFQGPGVQKKRKGSSSPTPRYLVH